MQNAFRAICTAYLFATIAYLFASDNQGQTKKKVLTRFFSYGNILNCDPQPSEIIQQLGEEGKHRISSENPMISPLAEDSFDAVCAVSSPTREPKEKHPTMLKTFYEILRPDGILIISLRKGEDQATDYSEEEVKKILASTGFEIIEYSVVEGSEPVLHEQFIEVLGKKTTPPHP